MRDQTLMIPGHSNRTHMANYVFMNRRAHKFRNSYLGQFTFDLPAILDNACACEVIREFTALFCTRFLLFLLF